MLEAAKSEHPSIEGEHPGVRGGPSKVLQEAWSEALAGGVVGGDASTVPIYHLVDGLRRARGSVDIGGSA
jgi:hypothetical protein